MIERLCIKNFAIIEEVDIKFKPGLTVITGETGSGKSILLEALAVALGSKADKIMVRNGAERAVVVAKFADAEIKRICLLYTSPSPRDATLSRMPSSA